MIAQLPKVNLSHWLLFASLACFSFTIFLLWQRHTPVTLSFTNYPQRYNSYSLTAEDPSTPNTLTIVELGIDSLPIIPGRVVSGRWPVSPKGLIHLTDSPQPGDVGNSIIYGHNWPNLLGPLSRAVPGQIIKVTNAAGELRLFSITKVSIVSPDQTDLLAPTDSPVLTIYTCTGFLDTLRLVVTATPL